MHVPLDEVANHSRFHEAVEAVSGVAASLLDGQGIALLARSKDGYRVVKSSGLPAGVLPEGKSILWDSRLATILSQEYRKGELTAAAQDLTDGLCAGQMAIAPILLHDGRLFGALAVLLNADNDWDRQQHDVLRNLATLVSFAVESELRLGRDRLTGLSTRSVLDDHLAIEIARSRRHGTWLALLVIDFEFPDRSPAVSDEWWLTRIAERLQSSVRRGDTVARVGAREIAVLVPDLRDSNAAQRVATAMIELLADPLPDCDDALEMLPSIGIALAPANGFNPSELFDRAVEALEHVRSNGGGTWELYSNVRLLASDQNDQT